MTITKPLEIKGEIKSFTQSGIAKCSPMKFETRIGELLFVLGYYSIQTTPYKGDWGADLLAIDPSGKKWVFQCKHYKKSIPVQAVDEAVRARYYYFKSESTAVITNSTFTTQAMEYAGKATVALIDKSGETGKSLKKMCDDANLKLDKVNDWIKKNGYDKRIFQVGSKPIKF